MANVYYKTNDTTCYYTNENKSGYTLVEAPGAYGTVGYAGGKNVIVELYNGTFVLPEHVPGLFQGATNTTFNDMDKWDFTACKRCHYMFANCSNLTSINLIGFKNALIKDTYDMFAGCSSLTSLDLQYINLSDVDISNLMFANCSSLVSITGFQKNSFIKSVRPMGMFSGCSALTNLDLSNVCITSAMNESLSQMFRYCSSLTTIDMSHWDISRATGTELMFNGCTSLKTVYMIGWNPALVTQTYSMFHGCSNLEHIYTSAGADWSALSNITNSDYMFYGCTKLPNFNASYVNKTKAFATSGGYFTPKSPSLVIGKLVKSIKNNSVNKDIIKIVNSNNNIIFIYQPNLSNLTAAYAFSSNSYVDTNIFGPMDITNLSEYRVKIRSGWYYGPDSSSYYIFGSAGGTGWFAFQLNKSDPYLVCKVGNTQLKCHNSSLSPANGVTYDLELRVYGSKYSVTADRSKAELFVNGTSVDKQSFTPGDISTRPFTINGVREWGNTPVAAGGYGIKNLVISRQTNSGEAFKELCNFIPIKLLESCPAGLSSTGAALNTNWVCLYDTVAGVYYPSAGTLNGA